MSTAVAPRHHRSTFVLVALCIVLLPLTQAGLGYLSGRGQSPWFWLVGTPICYLLISGLGAFCAAGGLVPVQARRRGSLIGIIAGIGGAVMATLIVALLIFWFLHNIQVHPSPASRSPGPGLALLEQMRARPRRAGVLVFVISAVLLTILMGVAFIVLTSGAFP